MTRLRALLAIAGVVLVAVPVASAHGIPDQVNDPPTGTSYGCGGYGPLFQGFSPSRRLLAAVDLRVRPGGSMPPGGTTFPVRIRRASPQGEVVGQGVAIVPMVSPLGTTVLTHVDFDQAVVLEPEGTFVIEGPSLNDSIVTWMGTELGTPSTYAGGTAFDCGGSSIADLDFNFATFTPTDSAAPETQITAGPEEGSFSRARQVSVTFDGSDDLSYASKLRFNCSIDGSAAACRSPFSSSGLSDGKHVFSVQAGDEAGNTDGSPATVSWTTDATPPRRPNVRGPRTTRSSHVRFSFTAVDGVDPSSKLRYRCSLDRKALRACGRSFRPVLKQGTHLLRVAAIDRAGNQSRTTAVRVVRLGSSS